MSKSQRPQRADELPDLWPLQREGSRTQTASSDGELIDRIYANGAVGGRTHQ